VFDAFRTGESVYERWFAEWRDWQPRFVIGYASALDGFAQYLVRSGRSVEGVRAVFSTAERLFDHQRKRIERAFAAPVRDQYGSREVPSIASECTAGRMHVYQDSAFLELLPSAAAGLRDIALTQLDNPSMPLIRYVNGDLSQWAEVRDECPCGLQYPALTGVHGRISDLLRFRGGRVVHGEYFTHIMYGEQDVVAFQFHQQADGDIILSVQPTTGADVEPLVKRLDAVLKQLPTQLGTSFRTSVKVVSEIPKHGQGKHRFTISDVTG
jgi:phenylacetate-CoA ligase